MTEGDALVDSVVSATLLWSCLAVAVATFSKRLLFGSLGVVPRARDIIPPGYSQARTYVYLFDLPGTNAGAKLNVGCTLRCTLQRLSVARSGENGD